jgi:hypothetical protein
MSEPPFKPFSLELGSFDPAKVKRPSAFVSLPDSLALLIAGIVTTWGAFERDFDDLLAAVIKANGTDEPNWRFRQFNKRRTLMAAESRRLFDQHPAIRERLSSIVNDSVELQLARNILTHGKNWIKIETGEPKDGVLPGRIALVCFREYKRKPMIKEFTPDDIDRLFYDIAHLNGRLRWIIQNDEALALSSPDRSFLQGFLNRDYQSSPIPQI